MYKHPILTKVPGDVSRGNEKEKQGYIKDIGELSRTELLDLKERQELLLRNKNRIAKLPDKGAKIKRFYEQIMAQLQIHDNVDKAAKLFSELNIASVGKKSLTKMEWSGNVDNRPLKNEVVIDSDDDIDDQNIDLLKILAQNTNPDKKIVVQKPEKLLITEQDLRDIEEMKQDRAECATANLVEVDFKQTANKLENMITKRLQAENTPSDKEMFDGHSMYLCQKESTGPHKERFLPFKTTTSNVHDSEKEKLRFLQHAKTWENTSATPPSIKHSPAQLLTLDESIRIQTEKNRILEQVKERYAEERLKLREEIKEKVKDTIRYDVMPDSAGFTTYRDVSDNESETSLDDDDDGYDLEAHDG